MRRMFPIIAYLSFLLTMIAPSALGQSIDTTMILGSKERVAEQINSLMEFENTLTEWDLGEWMLQATTAIPQQYGPGLPFGSDEFQIQYVKSQSQIMSGGEICTFFQATKAFSENKQPMYRYMEGLTCVYPGEQYSLEITMIDEGVRLSVEEQLKLYEESQKKQQEQADPGQEI